MDLDALPGVPPPESSDETRLDELDTVPSHHPRRTTLGRLQQADSWLTVDELAERVAWREEERPDGLSDGERESIRLSLCHTPLSKLVASNVFEYDPSDRTVGFRTPTGEV